MIFVVIMALISGLTFAFYVNSVGEILKEMGRKKKEFKERIHMFEDYIEKRGLDQIIKMKVIKYFEYLYNEEMSDNGQASILLTKLNANLL